MKTESLCDSREMSKMLKINRQTARKIMREGLITPVAQVGTSHIYALEDVENLRGKFFRDGLTHTQIARMYGKTRSAVIYWFTRLGIQPDGQDRRQNRAPAVYDTHKVQYVAKQLGWINAA